MKKSLYAFPILLVMCILLDSCLMDRSIAQHITDFENVTQNETPCFVQKNDGAITYFTTLKLVTGMFTSPHLLADGQLKIKPDEIKAYQDNDHYAVSQKIFVSCKRSHVAMETLPGFAIRVVKGKLNVYCKKFFNGERAVSQYYLQAGDEGEIRLYTPELMNDLVKADATAFEFFNNKDAKKQRSEKIVATVEMFNNGQMISKN